MIRSIGALGAGAALVATMAVVPAAVASAPRNYELTGVVDPATVTPAGFTIQVDGGNGPGLRVALRKGRSLGLVADANTEYITRTGYALDTSTQTDFAAVVAANANAKVRTRVRVSIRTPKPVKGKRALRGIRPDLVLSTPMRRVVDITNAGRPKGLARYTYRGVCTSVSTSTISVRVDGGNWRGMRSVLRAAAEDGSLNTVQTFNWNSDTRFVRWVGGRLQSAPDATTALGTACVKGGKARVGVSVWANPGLSVSDINSSAKVPYPANIVSVSEPAEQD